MDDYDFLTNKVYSFGDCNQFEPVEAGSQVIIIISYHLLAIKYVAQQRQRNTLNMLVDMIKRLIIC